MRLPVSPISLNELAIISQCLSDHSGTPYSSASVSGHSIMSTHVR